MKLASTLLLCAGLLASATAQQTNIPGTTVANVRTQQVTTTGLGLGLNQPAPTGNGQVVYNILGLPVNQPTTTTTTTTAPATGTTTTGTGGLNTGALNPATNYPVGAVFVQELPVVKSTVVPVPAPFPGAQTYSVRYDVTPNAVSPLLCVDIALNYATTVAGLATATAPIATQTQCLQITGATSPFTQYPAGTYIVSQLPSLGTAAVVGRYIEADVPADPKYGASCVQAVRASGAAFGATNTVTTRLLCLPVLPASTYTVAAVNQPVYFGL